ncbi:dimethyladenosine transferase 2, mitochondrial [Anastrepha obliqua]|uniref:dimethyladenosine transferase 2, mitochondrial n=1 Tax=Anastrepha obliqua TaxID=95512 RepID=UPI0024091B8B|nr:dimethyladenosine transferase 2, mitochondrial [Anastrepha obliqua]
MLHFRRFVHKGSPFANLFPDKLFNKRRKLPAHLYVADTQLVEQINNSIEPFMQQTKCDTAIEMNPGIGLFTRKLLNREDRIRKIVLIEFMEHFLPGLQDLHTLYPERVKVKQGDIVGLWKLSFQDRMDNGTRVADMLCDLKKSEYNDEPIAMLFGAVGCYNFFKHLINSIVFQNGLFSWGRLEMYLAIPPPLYIHLTCSNEIGYMFYRSTSILFQMMFEYRFITQLPREHFLPRQGENTVVKGSKLQKVESINPENLYLVRIVPRRNFLDLCPIADLQALWYFVKQNCVSRRNRIIPNLEKLVPRCGPRLIINSVASESLQPLYADENVSALPQYSKRCTTMSNRNFYPRMNIYTQFGDLSPSQMLTLFTQFRHWPEYSDSSFLASLESTLLKMEATADENITGITEEDDVPSDITDEEVTLEDIKKTESSEVKLPKKKRKSQTSK